MRAGGVIVGHGSPTLLHSIPVCQSSPPVCKPARQTDCKISKSLAVHSAWSHAHASQCSSSHDAPCPALPWRGCLPGGHLHEAQRVVEPGVGQDADAGHLRTGTHTALRGGAGAAAPHEAWCWCLPAATLGGRAVQGLALFLCFTQISRIL
jgi:hypothetical protein